MNGIFSAGCRLARYLLFIINSKRRVHPAMSTVFRPVMPFLAAFIFSLVLVAPIALTIGMAGRQSHSGGGAGLVFYHAVVGISR